MPGIGYGVDAFLKLRHLNTTGWRQQHDDDVAAAGQAAAISAAVKVQRQLAKARDPWLRSQRICCFTGVLEAWLYSQHVVPAATAAWPGGQGWMAMLEGRTDMYKALVVGLT